MKLTKLFKKKKQKAVTAYVLVKQHDNGEKVYFSFFRKKRKDAVFCNLLAFATWFTTEEEANDAKIELIRINIDYDKLRVEPINIDA